MRHAGLLSGSLIAHRSRQLAPLCGYPPDVVTSLSPCWSCEAWSHAVRRVRLDAKRPVRGLGEPQQGASGNPKGYPDALLAYIIGIPDSIQLIRSPRLPSECFTADQELGVIIGTKGSTRILVISSHCVFHQISVIEGVSDV